MKYDFQWKREKMFTYKTKSLSKTLQSENLNWKYKCVPINYFPFFFFLKKICASWLCPRKSLKAMATW